MAGALGTSAGGGTSAIACRPAFVFPHSLVEDACGTTEERRNHLRRRDTLHGYRVRSCSVALVVACIHLPVSSKAFLSCLSGNRSIPHEGMPHFALRAPRGRGVVCAMGDSSCRLHKRAGPSIVRAGETMEEEYKCYSNCRSGFFSISCAEERGWFTKIARDYPPE